MKVSIVIPVYNAERFLEKAIDSCLVLPEAEEIILVDDKSSDRSVEIAEKYVKKDKRVKLYFHPNKENKGTGASRNLGIMKANCEYVSFLDNDDFYLPNRFSKTKEVFEANVDIEGVYEAIGTYAYDEESLEVHMKRMKEGKKNPNKLELTTIDRPVKPEDLFEAVLFETYGWFHMNGLTLKKSIFEKTGLLDEYFIWSEDTEFFFRLSYYGKLLAGNLTEPVAMRGVYKGNRTLTPYGDERAKFYNVPMWKKMFEFMLKNKLSKRSNRYILMRHLDNISQDFVKREIDFTRKVLKGLNFLALLLKYPKLLPKIV